MTAASVATLYTATGAVYGSERERKQLVKSIQKAQSRRIGIWSLSKDAFESPKDYKQRTQQ